MYKYDVLVRINPQQTMKTVLWAENDNDAKQLAEAQYGVGNVMNWTRSTEESNWI